MRKPVKRIMSKRARQRRKWAEKERVARDAKIAMRGLNPVDRLPLAKRVYVASRVAGDSIREAAGAAQIATSTGRKYEEDPDVQKAYQHLIRDILPASKIAELIKGGTEATEQVYDLSGKLIRETPDWRTRRPYIEMAAEHGGYFVRKDANTGGGPVLNITVQHVGSPKQEPRTIDAA